MGVAEEQRGHRGAHHQPTADPAERGGQVGGGGGNGRRHQRQADRRIVGGPTRCEGFRCGPGPGGEATQYQGTRRRSHHGEHHVTGYFEAPSQKRHRQDGQAPQRGELVDQPPHSAEDVGQRQDGPVHRQVERAGTRRGQRQETQEQHTEHHPEEVRPTPDPVGAGREHLLEPSAHVPGLNPGRSGRGRTRW